MKNSLFLALLFASASNAYAVNLVPCGDENVRLSCKVQYIANDLDPNLYPPKTLVGEEKTANFLIDADAESGEGVCEANIRIEAVGLRKAFTATLRDGGAFYLYTSTPGSYGVDSPQFETEIVFGKSYNAYLPAVGDAVRGVLNGLNVRIYSATFSCVANR